MKIDRSTMLIGAFTLGAAYGGIKGYFLHKKKIEQLKDMVDRGQNPNSLDFVAVAIMEASGNLPVRPEQQKKYIFFGAALYGTIILGVTAIALQFLKK